MKLNEVFGSAIWVSADTQKHEDIFFLRGRFNVKSAKKATLRVIGLGTFHCYINGKRVGDDRMLPLSTEFEARKDFPEEEVVSGHRMYVPEYDITSYVSEGENVIAIHFGGGWYTANTYTRAFGLPKAIWRVFGCDETGDFDFCSSLCDKVSSSYVYDYDFTRWEKHDYRILDDAATERDFDDSAWVNAVAAKAPDTEYYFTDCPADKVCELITPKLIKHEWNIFTYDLGKNISGCPVLKLKGKAGEAITVGFSEEIRRGNNLDMNYTHNQCATFICSGKETVAKPLFTWFGFRYMVIQGDFELIGVENLHTDVKQTSNFCSDNATLNKIHELFVNTQLANMHSGIPSDCPHFERRGYTGDGQLICHTAMNMLDAKAFYRKWIYDICDGQDEISGHVQYTAPYVKSGGGPGGWGGAIVEVPYEYYRQYGETDILEYCYPKMLHYFDYLESHSEDFLVTRDKEGEWCLGDWCTPQSVVLPAPFVNNYFYIKSIYRCIEIARVIGKESDIPMLEARIAQRKAAINRSYYSDWDGNFLGGQQAANAFALDIGMGDKRTYPNLVERYEQLGTFDTGIFGTDILIRTLFKNGDADLAVKLITNEGVHSFAEMIKRGATTLWEYYPESLEERSHNHPMFGAVVAYYYDHLLGIKGEDAGYKTVSIAPATVQTLNTVSGYRTLPSGKVSVSYTKTESNINFTICIPEKQIASFKYDGKEFPLTAGENNFSFTL